MSLPLGSLGDSAQGVEVVRTAPQHIESQLNLLYSTCGFPEMEQAGKEKTPKVALEYISI